MCKKRPASHSLKDQKEKLPTTEILDQIKIGGFSNHCLKRWSRFLLLSFAINNLSILYAVAAEDVSQNDPSPKLFVVHQTEHIPSSKPLISHQTEHISSNLNINNLSSKRTKSSTSSFSVPLSPSLLDNLLEADNLHSNSSPAAASPLLMASSPSQVGRPSPIALESLHLYPDGDENKHGGGNNPDGQRNNLDDEASKVPYSLMSDSPEGSVRSVSSSEADSLLQQPVDLSQQIQPFLDSMNWTVQDLEDHNISLSTLDKLLAVETSRLWNNLRWATIDRWVARAVHYPLLDYGGLGHSPKTLEAQGHSTWARFFLWGRTLPLQSGWTIRKALASDAFRDGVEQATTQGLKFTLTAALTYQLAQPSSDIMKAYAIYSSSHDNTITALSSQFYHHPILFSIFATPFTWGTVRSLLSLRSVEGDGLTLDYIDTKRQILDSVPTGLWYDYFRWLLPLHPTNRVLRSLEQKLLWEGRETRKHKTGKEEREEAFRLIDEVAQNRKGLSQAAGLYGLTRLAYGLHLKDIPLLKEAQTDEALLHYLSLKIRAFESLQHLKPDNYLVKLYQDYYLWELGQSPSFWKTSVPMALFKGTKLAIHTRSFILLLEVILNYLDCPEEPGITFAGPQPWASDFTQDCFDELVNLFNTIPGQPAHTLTDVISQYHFSDSTYPLNLAGKGLTEKVILDILQGFADHTRANTGPTLTGLNLSNNQFGSQDDQHTVALADLLTQFPRLTTLDLSNNQIGLKGIQGVQALATTLPHLSDLTTFKILPSRTLSARMIALLNLEDSPDLLPQPVLLTSADNVRVFFQTAPLNTSAFDFSKKITDDPQGQVLTTLMASLTDYPVRSLDLSNSFIGSRSDKGVIGLGQGLADLPSLRSLDFSNNYIGYTRDEGATVLSTNLAKLPQLTSLDLSNNWFGFNGNQSIQALAQTLKQSLPSLKTFIFLPSTNPLSASMISTLNLGLTTAHPSIPPLAFPLTDPNAVKLFFKGIAPGVSSFTFSNVLIDDAQGATLTALMQGLISYNQTISSLDFSNNPFLGSKGGNGTQAIGNSLQYFTALTSLDFSNNPSLGGNYKYAGTVAIGNSLQYLTRLTSLDLSNNPNLGYYSDDETVAIGNSLQYLTALTSLNLSSTKIGYPRDAGTVAIGNSLQYLTSLTSLNLSNNYYIGSKGYQAGPMAIINSLQYLTALTFLDLSSNNLGSAFNIVEQTIGNSLQYLKALTSLNLSNNQNLGRQSDTGMITIGNSLGNLTHLTSLDLSHIFSLGLKGDNST